MSFLEIAKLRYVRFLAFCLKKIRGVSGALQVSGKPQAGSVDFNDIVLLSVIKRSGVERLLQIIRIAEVNERSMSCQEAISRLIPTNRKDKSST